METTGTTARTGAGVKPAGSRHRITVADLERGSDAFERYEGRDSMYRVATFLLDQWWGRHPDMVDALSVLLLTWNSAFYRYGMFDQEKLEKCLKDQWDQIQRFHDREISSLGDEDQGAVRTVFNALRDALQIREGKKKGKKSSVAVAKTLHLLAPRFFPLWDAEIADVYGCDYAKESADAYVRFCGIIRDIAMDVGRLTSPSPKSLLKRIDEYNNAKYTKEWI